MSQIKTAESTISKKVRRNLIQEREEKMIGKIRWVVEIFDGLCKKPIMQTLLGERQHSVVLIHSIKSQNGEEKKKEKKKKEFSISVVKHKTEKIP